jgi:polyvinyl alcohol dehydrogenase (cytochrome)
VAAQPVRITTARIGATAVLAALALLAAACGPREAATPGATPAATSAATAAPAAHPGEAVYRARCANCHEGGAYKAPDRLFLGMMPPDGV